MTELLGLPISTLAPSAIAGVAVLMVLTGVLVPWRIYQKSEKTIEWQRKRIETDGETIAELQRHGKVMEDGFRIVEKFGTDLQKRIEP